MIALRRGQNDGFTQADGYDNRSRDLYARARVTIYRLTSKKKFSQKVGGI